MNQRRTKVLLTVPNFECTESPWREAMALARHVSKSRIDLTVCGLRPSGFEETQHLLGDLGVKCLVARFRPKGWGIRTMLDSMGDYGLLRRLGKFDVQHSMDFTPSPWEAALHSLVSRRFHFSQRNFNENGSVAALRLKCKASGEIVCISTAVEEFLRKLRVRNRMRLVYPGIECDRFPFRNGIPPGRVRRQLLMVGHVARRKDILVGIRALAILVGKGHDLELAIAGRIDDETYKLELENEARTLGIGGRVSFMGPRRDVLELMRDAVALLHTAGSEAFGMVVIEALAIGLPVIAPDHQGPREIIEHERSGLLAKPGDPVDFAGGLERLLSNPGYGERLAQQGRRRVEEFFSAQRMTEGFENLYVSCGS